MKTTIKNRGGESTLTISGDFRQILDENFTAVCTAIEDEVRILQELQRLSEENAQLADIVIQVIRSSCVPEEAVGNLQEKMNMSEMAAKNLMDWPLFDLGSLNSEKIERNSQRFRNISIRSIHYSNH